MRFEPFATWQSLGIVGFRDRGEYDPEIVLSEEPYRYFDFVYYEGSSWLALLDNPVNPPSELNPEWKLLALGFRDAELQIAGVKGDAEIEYRTGYVNLTKADLGLERVDNIGLEDIQKETVASFSWNGGGQRLKGDIDIPVVNGIIYNGKEIRQGIVRINSIEGISINGQPIKRGVVVTDIVTGLRVNGRHRQIGEADLHVIEGMIFNGRRIFEPVPIIEAVEGIRVNNGSLEKGFVNLDSVTSLAINGRKAKRGDLELSIVESLSVNGKHPRNGHLDLDVVHGISVNGARYKRGFVDLDIVTGFRVNGREEETETGIVDLTTVETLSVNGNTPQFGKVNLEVVEGITLNNNPVPLKEGVVDLNAVTEVEFNEGLLEVVNGRVSFNAITSITINGRKIFPKKGNLSLEDDIKAITAVYLDDIYIPDLNGKVNIQFPNRHKYAVCSSYGDDLNKQITVKRDFKLEHGSVIHIKFENTNTVYPLTLQINENEPKPLFIKGEEITEYNLSTFKENGIYSFIFDGSAWNLLNGTNNPVDIHYVTLIPDNFYEKSDMYFYDLEIKSKEEDIININHQLGLPPKIITEFGETGIYTYSQEDNKITLCSYYLPKYELPVIITVQ